MVPDAQQAAWLQRGVRVAQHSGLALGVHR